MPIQNLRYPLSYCHKSTVYFVLSRITLYETLLTLIINCRKYFAELLALTNVRIAEEGWILNKVLILHNSDHEKVFKFFSCKIYSGYGTPNVKSSYLKRVWFIIKQNVDHKSLNYRSILYINFLWLSFKNI